MQKASQATADLISNKTANRITKASRTSPQNNSETFTNEAENIELDKEIPKERYISPEQRQKIIDDLRLI